MVVPGSPEPPLTDRLDLDDQVPDLSTFSVNRHGRFRDSDILRHVFESVVRACMDSGLIKGEGFAVDASIMEADARFTKTIGTVRVAFCNAAKADPRRRQCRRIRHAGSSGSLCAARHGHCRLIGPW
jgi:hypothetical protein